MGRSIDTVIARLPKARRERLEAKAARLARDMIEHADSLGAIRKAMSKTHTALADPKIRGRLEEMGLFVVGSTPDQLAAYPKSELAKWGPVIRDAGIKIE